MALRVQWFLLRKYATELNEVGKDPRNFTSRVEQSLVFRKRECPFTALIDDRGAQARERQHMEASAIFDAGESTVDLNHVRRRRELYQHRSAVQHTCQGVLQAEVLLPCTFE